LIPHSVRLDQPDLLMARRERDREDLLAEATALAERMELRVDEEAEPMVLGVRRDGCLSIYFSADCAVHFNTRQEVRRMYLDGALIKAECGKLVSMRRERSERAVELLSHELSAAEQQRILAEMRQRITATSSSLERSTCQVVRQIPADFPALERAKVWLARLPSELTVAALPNAR
jgi:hypothetical protein